MDMAARKDIANLDRIKTNIRRAYDYFKHNYDRFNEFRRFVFESSLTSEEITLLMTQSRPQLEFNVVEAYISRLLGEFSKQQPDIMVSADDQTRADPMTIKIVEEHLRHTLNDHNNHHTRYEIYKDLLSGGFSTLKMSTDYSHPMSFKQIINIDRAFDPTLCGFDQLARYSHKGDGRFCFELYPMEKDSFEEQNPEIAVSNISFRRDFSGFNWSYLNDATPIVMVAEYFEKEEKETRIVQLTDGKVMTYDKYRKMRDEWDKFELPPGISGKPRTTNICSIIKYRMIENQFIKVEETDFMHLPLIFADGNSILIKTPKNGNVRQVTRPYIYHAKGAQRLKNYAGIALANEIENTIQHKFMVAKEALPKEEDLLQAYKDVQKANVVVYNSIYEEDPDKPIPNPIREIQRVPAPPEMTAAFSGSDSLIQNILGSYDAALGINDNQLSGVAIVEAASQSNATAMPYIVGYLDSFQRAAEVYVDLMPKYFKTPMTLPLIDKQGRRGYIKLNQEDGLDLDYDSNSLNVTVKAGASFQIQKARTLTMVKEISGMSPLFAQFMAEKGLPFILDNMEGRGIEQLKELVDEWLQEYQKDKQAARDQAQNDPQTVKNELAAKKLQLDSKKLDLDSSLKQQELAVKVTDTKLRHDATVAKSMAEKLRAEADVTIKAIDVKHQHDMSKIDNAHRHAKDIAAHHLAKEQLKHQKSQGARHE